MDLKTACRNCAEQTAEEKRELELEILYISYLYIYIIYDGRSKGPCKEF